MALSPSIDIDVQSVGESYQTSVCLVSMQQPCILAVPPQEPPLHLYIAAIVLGLWWFWLSSVNEELIAEQHTEQTLRDQYKSKLVRSGES